jgi:DNA invertase Pin-like site-specific DNA recombinase
MLVCHRCDVPQCVNPDHLFLGTQADNMADMVRKGRASRLKGQRNGRAKINDDQAREVRDLLHLKAFSASEIARSYRVSTSTIGRIKSGETFTAVWQGYAK